MYIAYHFIFVIPSDEFFEMQVGLYDIKDDIEMASNKQNTADTTSLGHVSMSSELSLVDKLLEMTLMFQQHVAELSTLQSNMNMFQ